MTFSTLGLAPRILEALETEGYSTPTPIQAKAIPPILTGRDLLGLAQTGTGKTAAFALPILQRLAADRRRPIPKGCRTLVLSPTRELATQIAESFRTYGRRLDVSVAVVFGGTAHRPQVQALARGVDVLVATPGRLLDHVAGRTIVLQGTDFFVLDEADQMLDLGFVKPIRRIVSHLPSRRQNLFFSATLPREIATLANELLHQPVKVSVAPSATTVACVSQRVIHVEARKKGTLLVELFADPAVSRALVFTRTKRGADRVARRLDAAGIPVAAIHGNKSQPQRERALDAFRTSKARALVATDVAARGIDIDFVSHVVNYELPDVAESYVHRIGRTARAGAAGIAIAFCDDLERDQLRDIERLIRQTIPSEDRRNDARLAADRTAQGPARAARGRGGAGKGPRPSRARPRDEADNPRRQNKRDTPRSRPADPAALRGHVSPAVPPAPRRGSAERGTPDPSGMAGVGFMSARRTGVAGSEAKPRMGRGRRWSGGGRSSRHHGRIATE